MARRKDLGVIVVFRCPDCGDWYHAVAPAGSGLKPGDVVDEPHLPGMCSWSVTFTDVDPAVMSVLLGGCPACGGAVDESGACRNRKCQDDQTTRAKD